MAKLTAAEAAQLHAERLIGASARIEKGIMAVTESPGKKAAAAQNKMKTNLIRSIDDGTWARQVQKMSLTEWQKRAVEKGIPRIAIGVAASMDKTTEFYEKLFAFQDPIVNKVKAMPSTTLQDSIARVTAYMTEMSKFKR